MSILERFSAFLLFSTLLRSILCCGSQDGDRVSDEEWSLGTEAECYTCGGAVGEPVPQRDAVRDVVMTRQPGPVQNQSCVDRAPITQGMMRSAFHIGYTPTEVPSEAAYSQ